MHTQRGSEVEALQPHSSRTVQRENDMEGFLLVTFAIGFAFGFGVLKESAAMKAAAPHK
jgi:hypothetical protein